MALTRGAPNSKAITHMGAQGIRRFNSLKSGDWSKPTRLSSDSPSRRGPPRTLASRPQQPITGPRKQSFVESFQFPEAGPSNEPNPQALRQGRQRVASSPSMPAKLRYTSPRRLAAHLHEVKPTISRRRHALELEDGLAESDPFYTPRGSRILSPSGSQVSEVGRRRRPRSRERPRSSESVRTVTDLLQTLPTGTSKVDDTSEWEDTTTEDETDETTTYLASRPNPSFKFASAHITPSPSHSPSRHRTSFRHDVVTNVQPPPQLVA